MSYRHSTEVHFTVSPLTGTHSMEFSNKIYICLCYSLTRKRQGCFFYLICGNMQIVHAYQLHQVVK